MTQSKDYTIGEIVKGQLYASELTTKEYAEQIGVNVMVINRLIWGQNLPRLESFLKIAEFIGWDKNKAILAYYQGKRDLHKRNLRKRLGI